MLVFGGVMLRKVVAVTAAHEVSSDNADGALWLVLGHARPHEGTEVNLEPITNPDSSQALRLPLSASNAL